MILGLFPYILTVRRKVYRSLQGCSKKISWFDLLELRIIHQQTTVPIYKLQLQLQRSQLTFRACLGEMIAGAAVRSVNICRKFILIFHIHLSSNVVVLEAYGWCSYGIYCYSHLCCFSHVPFNVAILSVKCFPFVPWNSVVLHPGISVGFDGVVSLCLAKSRYSSILPLSSLPVSRM